MYELHKLHRQHETPSHELYVYTRSWLELCSTRFVSGLVVIYMYHHARETSCCGGTRTGYQRYRHIFDCLATRWCCCLESAPHTNRWCESAAVLCTPEWAVAVSVCSLGPTGWPIWPSMQVRGNQVQSQTFSARNVDTITCWADTNIGCLRTLLCTYRTIQQLGSVYSTWSLKPWSLIMCFQNV